MDMNRRLPLLLFLSCVFLASVSFSVGSHTAEPRPGRELDDCLSRCAADSDMYRRLACKRSCELKEHGREPEERRPGDEGKQSQETRENPYHFQSQRFQSRFRNNNGEFKVLPKFDRTSNLLRVLKNYRLAVYEARPNTVSIPHHSDADFILIVVRGNATVTFINKENRESYNLDHADVLRVPAGSTTLIVNRNNNENLRIIKLVNPVANPGEFEDFFAGGRDNPQSYLRVFSDDVLQASFNRPMQEIERTLFGEQQRQQQGRQGERGEEGEQGFIVRAPEERIRTLSQKASSTKKGKSTKSGPFNLISTKPEFSNEFGQFFEARPNEFQQIQDMDVAVDALEIQKGAVMLPHFNTRATKVVYVYEGTGKLEIACPHMASQRGQRSERGSRKWGEEEESEQSEWRSGRTENVRADVSPGDVVVIPAGHPFAITASQNQNLRMVGFGINAENNQRNFVAGQKDNVLRQLEREEQDLSFQGRGEEVESLFKSQRESYFARGGSERRQGQEGMKGPLSSILTGFF